MEIKIIGGGLAGTECALYLANKGVKVDLYEMKPTKFSPAHKSQNLAELVCSNSLKSNDVFGNACGLLKEEMRLLGSKIIEVADKTRVPAGNALAVNREEFSAILTQMVQENSNITIHNEEVDKIDLHNGITVIATGPLTSDSLAEKIQQIVGDGLHFFDASAPIIDFNSIDMDNAFFGDRYGKGNSDHINCPMNKEQYELFIQELLSATKAMLHSFDKREVFEGCMPIEIMASRGKDTLRFGPLKPTGLDDPKTGRWPYACLQLRKEDEQGSMYNLVGFQTNLSFPEQKRVFGIIPALKNVEFLRYGVMHRNTFINSTLVLNKDYSLKEHSNVYFAGQITGVEGYVESSAVGLMCGIYIYKKLMGEQVEMISDKTILGSLAKYITTENKDFEPMNANFGILPSLDMIIRDKAEKKKRLAERSLECVKEYIKENLQ